jgi:iron complex transport system ATP-binding protein
MGNLVAKNLTVNLQGKEILTDITISFKAGLRTAIIGPNGCGKSTLLRAVSGLSHNYHGEVLLDDKKLRSFKQRELSKRIAILPQGTSAPMDLTVGELVEYGRFPYRSWFKGNTKEDKEAINWAIEQTKLQDLIERQVSSLSGGERQRAWIAMALAQKPEILLLDEPTTYLDIAHQLEVMQIVEDLNQKFKITVVMVLHDINHARQYADEIVVIKNHQIFSQGNPDEVLTEQMLRKVFGVVAEKFVNEAGKSIWMPLSLVEKNEMDAAR